MKNQDELLQRLLRAAARAPAPAEAAAPWAASRCVAERLPSEPTDLRRRLRLGLSCASLILAVTVVVSLLALAGQPGMEVALPNAEVNLVLSQ